MESHFILFRFFFFLSGRRITKTQLNSWLATFSQTNDFAIVCFTRRLSVRLFVCLFVRTSRENYKWNLDENFTRDVSLDREEQ